MDTHDIRSYWTPRVVVATLSCYTDLRADLEAAIIVPSDDTLGLGSACFFEPGSLIEKLACRVADIDLAMDRLPPHLAQALKLYFVDPGGESFRGVALAMRCHHRTARDRVLQGVAGVAERLCGTRMAGEEAATLVKSAA